MARIAEEGFDQAGIMSAGELPDLAPRFQTFIQKGWHGDMDWFAEKLDRRSSPRGLWPDVNSVIVVGMNYGPETDPLDHHGQSETGVISCYAQHKDYHDVIKKRIRRIARWLSEQSGADVKIFVDTAPVPEKALAQAAGLGWQGKHTNLVSKSLGSWLFLGCIYTELDLAADDAEINHCGTCQECIDICPTNAFPVPYQLDARRCISYLTIEHKGPIPLELRAAIGNRIYGCDDCLSVCPWNKFAQASKEAAFHPRESLVAPKLAKLAELDDAAFRQFFTASPVKRIGRDRFIRNVLVALGNGHDPSAWAAIKPLLKDASPLVRGAAVWAASQVLDASSFAAIRQEFVEQEPDPDVSLEWSRSPLPA